ncbi:SusC/RagA family TonB-linked outer membrane protein [Cyclobacteriaceae bacterium]|nr:SusC/RagA family TonB-linked outer membrane protein [Cyclobacteriaceae bacterium]
MKLRLTKVITMITKYSIYGLVFQSLFLNMLLANPGRAQKNVSVREVKVALNSDDLTVKKIFSQIEEKSDFRFAIDKSDLKSELNQIVNIEAGEKAVSDILLQVSKDSKTKFRQINNNITVSRLGLNDTEVILIVKQERTVKGTVTDDDNQGIPGVNVVLKGTSTGSVTDLDGNFVLSLPEEGGTLIFSFIGMASQEVTVGSRSVIDVTLLQDATQMSEIIVSSLGIERDKKSLGYFAQEIKGEKLVNARETNFLNNISGRVAGVDIQKTGNGPGGSTGVLIRGGGGFLSGSPGRNQPLFVVDGIPIDNYQTATSTDEYGSTDQGNGAQHINPDDIETMTVLKGPEAAALYGSRGMTGVILITTKKGTQGQGLGVKYSGSFTFENPLVMPDIQNEYGQGSNGSYDVLNQFSWGPKLTGQTVTDWTGSDNPLTADPDDLKNFLQTGTNFTNSIDITGGTEKATFRLGYTNLDSKGIVPNSSLKRNMITLRSTAKLTDKFSADAKISYNNEKVVNRPITSGSPNNIFTQYMNRPRNVQFEDMDPWMANDGSMILWSPQNFSTLRNPYWVMNEDYNEDNTDRIFSMVKLDYRFTPWLKAFARYGSDFRSAQVEGISAYGVTDPATGIQNSGSGYSAGNTRAAETNIDFLVTASQTFGDLNIALNVGGNSRHNTFFNTAGSTGQLDLPGVYNLAYGSFNRPTSFQSESRIRSIYAFTNLGFKDYLFLDLTYRNDWSSNLSEDVWSFAYPSASMSFVLSDAVSLPNVISFAKIRGAASQGASDLEPYLLSPTYAIGRGFLNVISTSTPSILLDAKIKPEFVVSQEIGLDLKMFNNRVGVELAVYNKTITDQILDLPVPGASGYNFKKVNAGEVESKGFELMVSGTPVQTSDFQWNIVVNYATNETKLINLVDGVERLFLQNDASSRAIRIVADEGQPFGDIYGRDYQRDDNEKIIVDASGIPIKGAEKNTLIGNTQQDFTMGFINDFTYRGINFGFLIDWKQGGQFYSQSMANMHNFGTASGTLAYREGGLIVDGVTEDGVTNTAAITSQQYWNAVAGYEPVASEFIYDATSIRLREAYISYSLPQNVVSKTPFNSLSVGVTARNLWLIKSEIPGIDPETSFSVSNARGWENGGFPSTKVYGFNINVGF